MVNQPIKVYLKHNSEVGAVTVISGISSDMYDLQKLAKVLKGMIGAKKKRVNEEHSRIYFLGDHIERVKQLLDTIGFT